MAEVIKKKKLIEVALPLDDINKACVREKSIRHGHPSTLHLWWARRPLAAARAVIFAQMVDDPSSHPELFPTEADQERERERLFDIIRRLVLWESTTNEGVLNEARAELWRSWRLTCAENVHHAQATEIFDPEKLPPFYDPFSGGSSLPLEAQRLGLESYAADLNPVAVLINKAMIEIPPKFANRAPVNPEASADEARWSRQWRGAQGLAEDVRYYGKWMRDEAEARIGYLYPKIDVTAEMVADRPDLKPYLGRKLTVIAWLWARTVKSPNPAFAHIDVPLASSFTLSTKPGTEAYVEPCVESSGYHFAVRAGQPKTADGTKNGTKLARGANFRCIMSGAPIEGDYVKSEGKSGRMGARLMAIVAEGDRGRVYLSPTKEHEALARTAEPSWKPETNLPDDPRNFWTVQYGLTTFGDLFTSRQLVALTTFSDLVEEARAIVKRDALIARRAHESSALVLDNEDFETYADAVAVYLAIMVSRSADRHNTICSWDKGPSSSKSSTGSPARSASVRNAFSRQSLPMTWDFAEGNPLSDSATNIMDSANWICKVLERLDNAVAGHARQADAQSGAPGTRAVISTDPPYYDNIGYADLSDFFYVWQRRTLRDLFPDLYATISVPKAEELVATPYRHGNKDSAERFFLEGMTAAMHRLAEQGHPAIPTTIYYAFKQSETDAADGTASTGWETFLQAVIRAGFDIGGTWPLRTELANRIISKDTNALASSIVLVCRPRQGDAPTVTRREFVSALKAELPQDLARLQHGNIAPVDLAQAAIGPGMAIFTRYSRVVDSDGKLLTVRDALALINEVLDEVFAAQEGDFDAATRFAIAWFEQMGFDEGETGLADVLARAKNTTITGLVKARIAEIRGSKVRLLKPNELPLEWEPSGGHFTVWEMTHHLIRSLNIGGESSAAALAAKIASGVDVARELGYRLYSIAERKKRSADALSYNALVQSWPEIVRLSKERVALVNPIHVEMFATSSSHPKES